MATEDLRNIFGMAITVAYIRAYSYGAPTAQKMCQGMANGFGMSETDGDSIYDYFSGTTHPESISDFNDHPYTDMEANSKALFVAQYPSLSDKDCTLLAMAGQAVLFAYTLNSCISISDLQKLLGRVLASVAQYTIGYSPFMSYEKVIYTPYSSTSVVRTMIAYDYSSVIRALNTYPKETEAKLANYNWFDLSKVLHGPDIQKMKDIENQYYYVSGKLLYENMVGEVEPCIEDTATIATWSGTATFNYIRNTPCRDQSSYVGPVDYLKFYRKFNDGPPSSGYFDTGVLNFYKQNDRNVLPTGDYVTNSFNLSDTSGAAICSNVFVDANGRYSLIEEYKYVDTGVEYCGQPYQRMHVGDNASRILCSTPPFCICTPNNVTGFKYVSVELPDEDWTSDLQFRQSAPLSTTEQIRRRSWSILDNPYVATAEGDTLMPYWTDPSPPYTQYWYVGYPVLNGQNILPQFAFFQQFDNSSFGTQASICMFPCLSAGAGNVGDWQDVSRSYALATGYTFSGAQSNGVDIFAEVSANMSGKDVVTKKFFGMGAAFSGKYDIALHEEENAGFLYTGFVVTETGQLINAVTLADGYSGKIIGQYKTIKYITGYARGTERFELTNRYGFDSTGNPFTFGYFYGDTVRNIPQNGWSYFCPEPTVFTAADYTREFAEQTVESYWPRYFEGPFSSETRKFLYPNAAKSDVLRQGKLYGIPRKVNFVVDVREETVREIFGKWNIYPDGAIASTPEYVRVIRPDVMGTNKYNPYMTRIFHPNGGEIGYDFNLYGVDDNVYAIDVSAELGTTLVDNSWAPLISGKWVPNNRNSNQYGNTITPTPQSLFSMGVRKWYNGTQTHVQIKQTGSYVEFSRPRPRSDGLFHGYKAYTQTGYINYTLPIFDLTKNSMYVSPQLLEAFYDTTNNEGLAFAKLDGAIQTILTGVDPMWYEYVGGRRGSAIAAKEGGYHSKGIIGDRWLGETREAFGVTKQSCSPDGEHTYYFNVRYPMGDSRMMLFNTDASGTDLWTHGMKFAPHFVQRVTGKLTSDMRFPYSVDTTSGYLDTWVSGDYINFDFAALMPLRARTGVLDTDEEWYCQTGCKIGPFDRDVEIGITDSQKLLAASELYVNGEQLSHYFQDTNDCDRNWFTSIGRWRWIQTSEPWFNPRSQGYSIICIVPSGKQVTFNVKSLITSGWWPEIIPTDPVLSYIGLSGRAILSMRTHVGKYAEDYDYLADSGEYSWAYPHWFTSNGTEAKWRLKHDGPENIGNTYEFMVFNRTGKLYPKPDETAYAKLATYDAFGNPDYSNVTPEIYWRTYAIKNNTVVPISGIREGTRISFTIRQVQAEQDVLPYQTYRLVSPSGKCFVSGKFGYAGQADNCIFAEGVHLINATENDAIAENYNPEYVSDVLRLIPPSYFTMPTSTDETAPVLVAPSVMKQRENQDVIEENQVYLPLLKYAPYHYNKLLWPALSDLETLNPGETIESIPGGDGETFPSGTLLFSASQGQLLPNGGQNPNIIKQYYVQDIFQIYSSVSTVAYVNPAQCITSGRGPSVYLSQADMSGALVPAGTSLALIKAGLA